MNLLIFFSILTYQVNVFFSKNLFSKRPLFKNYNIKYNLEMNNKDIKFCKDCKYFLPNIFIIPNNDFGKCALYSKTVKNDENYLVTGKIKKQSIEYSYCSITRNNEDACGKEGKDFIPRDKILNFF